MGRLSATFAQCQAGLHGRRCEYVSYVCVCCQVVRLTPPKHPTPPGPRVKTLQRRAKYILQVYTGYLADGRDRRVSKKILRQRGKSFRSISDLCENPPPRESMASQPGEHLHLRPGSVLWIRVQSQDWKYMQGDDDGMGRIIATKPRWQEASASVLHLRQIKSPSQVPGTGVLSSSGIAQIRWAD
jgi:hypothetical protein